MAIIAFIITIGVLVIVHEFGHYIVARICKVKVLTFSIGFGPKLVKIKGKHNDWVISAIPLGGYVRMLDEREMEVPQDKKSQTFNSKPPYQKILIALAGPLANILFAIAVYFVVAIMGVSEFKPVIGSIDNTYNIKSINGLDANMVINSLDGKVVSNWNDLDTQFHKILKTNDAVTLNITSNGISKNLNLNLKEERSNYNNKLYLETLGIYPDKFMPIIAYIEPDSVAYLAKLKLGDKIIKINGINNPDWFNFLSIIKNSANTPINMTISRNGQVIPLVITPKMETVNGAIYGKLGIMPQLDIAWVNANTIERKYGIFDGLSYAVKSCYRIVNLNLSILSDMLTGKISTANLGGPISIAQAGKMALSDGVKRFADFLALISLGLAVMNLLPIPVLDGGHIVIYIFELISGKEMSHKIQILIFKLGFVFILGISVYAIYNDILRILH